MLVKATREGRHGRPTRSGYIVDELVPFVSLPCAAALGQWVIVTNMNSIDPVTGTGRSVHAVVLDVGPCNTRDFRYVFGGDRPQAESGTDVRGRKTNGAGIGLGEAVWRALQMTDNGQVHWVFAASGR